LTPSLLPVYVPQEDTVTFERRS
jgi:hypothetical protein